jgi:hypothetical protein
MRRGTPSHRTPNLPERDLARERMRGLISEDVMLRVDARPYIEADSMTAMH